MCFQVYRVGEQHLSGWVWFGWSFWKVCSQVGCRVEESNLLAKQTLNISFVFSLAPYRLSKNWMKS